MPEYCFFANMEDKAFHLLHEYLSICMFRIDNYNYFNACRITNSINFVMKRGKL